MEESILWQAQSGRGETGSNGFFRSVYMNIALESENDILAHSPKIDTQESFTVLFFSTKVSTLISVEGGKALSRSLNARENHPLL